MSVINSFSPRSWHLKILQARLQLYMWTSRCSGTMNFQMFKLDLEKAEEPEIKLPTSTGSSKKQESSRRASISTFLTMPKPWTVWITTNHGKFFKRWEYQTTLPASWEICMQVKKQQLEPGMEQQTGSKLGKNYIKAVYCHPAYVGGGWRAISNASIKVSSWLLKGNVWLVITRRYVECNGTWGRKTK